jgi:RNA polymerase sigma factor (sigma-70 family)
MVDDSTVELQRLLDRVHQGEPEAQRRLLERAHARLKRLAAKLLNQSFPALRPQHELDSIVHESWFRLIDAVDAAQPATVLDFFRLAAHKIRQVLLDLVQEQRRQQARETPLANDSHHGESAQAWTGTYDPVKLSLWTEFHRRVDDLEPSERSVFELHYYLDVPQAEIARLLDLHPRKVSYLWVAATERLAEGLDAFVG